ncbi:peptide deformylase [Acinetobacter sp. LoGeW2-3]|uniref:peptide deformylase n=1 Tax=Acinetobacter sp. LoGeW2-3 TaxID=1808001 RepID=UPI000C059DF6|nr:peptide deformylase [Acinetobacter sp. LoGeW2-3]ATO19780.1 peptide deformylase [Acinetobacter sp. LoGeW2-3]
MTVLTVAKQGEAILGLVATTVADSEFGSEWLYQLNKAMMDTMLDRQGVGIAAPQVYISKRVIIVASRPNLRYPDAPFMEPVSMVNPEILHASETQVQEEEGCLSVPDQRGKVARAQDIWVRYYTMEGAQVDAEFSGFAARIVQHEIDHLNGILFTERL